MATVDDLLEAARARIDRVTPQAAVEAIGYGALLVDTRPLQQRQQEGEIPGALLIERNVLEWRLDPTSPWRLPEVTNHDQQVVVLCDEGYASSLAAASLQSLGLHRATDLDGGYQAWLRWSNGFDGAASDR